MRKFSKVDATTTLNIGTYNVADVPIEVKVFKTGEPGYPYRMEFYIYNGKKSAKAGEIYFRMSDSESSVEFIGMKVMDSFQKAGLSKKMLGLFSYLFLSHGGKITSISQRKPLLNRILMDTGYCPKWVGNKIPAMVYINRFSAVHGDRGSAKKLEVYTDKPHQISPSIIAQQNIVFLPEKPVHAYEVPYGVSFSIPDRSALRMKSPVPFEALEDEDPIRWCACTHI